MGMKESEPMSFTLIQLITLRKAVKTLGNLWGEPITTEYTEPLFAIFDKEIARIREDKEKMLATFDEIVKEW